MYMFAPLCNQVYMPQVKNPFCVRIISRSLCGQLFFNTLPTPTTITASQTRFYQATSLQPAYTTRATKMITAPKTADTPAKMIAAS